jgi:hypothetical protein
VNASPATGAFQARIDHLLARLANVRLRLVLVVAESGDFTPEMLERAFAAPFAGGATAGYLPNGVAAVLCISGRRNGDPTDIVTAVRLAMASLVEDKSRAGFDLRVATCISDEIADFRDLMLQLRQFEP